jgi:small-conductance mechanosensitive channel
MRFLGIEWVGINAENGRKLLLSLIFITALLLLAAALRGLSRLLERRSKKTSVQTQFWIRQGINLLTTILLILGLLSIWFSDPARLATALGLMSAGLAFALQQVVTSIAGYFVILRGNTFTVGDRITMGGVRGDVLQLGFIQTTIMEMGQPPSVQGADPAMWVRSRQFTGRIVTVSNSKIFDEPVFNYSRDFPIIWEELAIPITYTADRARAEAILLQAAHKFAIDPQSLQRAERDRLHDEFHIEPAELEPRVFYRLTDNWLELSVRFITGTHGIRGVKDSMSRFVIAELDQAGIGIASATYDIVGFPALRMAPSDAADQS